MAEVMEGYRLVNCIHSGADTQVWEVVEVKSQRHFAMKVVLEDKAKNSTVLKTLVHEANVGKELSHPNVIKIHDINTKAKTPFFVMEFFPAGSLKARMVRKQFDFIKEHAHGIMKQASVAFAYMNATGYVHRDVKPENMLVNSAAEVKIIDFALAQRIQTDSWWSRLFKKKGAVQGTRSYMSPEQIRGEPLDGRADVYSFGATMYEIVANRPPFRAPSNQELLQKHIREKPQAPRHVVPEVTEEFSQLVMRMLEKKREDRPQSFHEVLKALNGIQVYRK